MSDSRDHGQGSQRLRKVFVECRCTCYRDDLIVLCGDQLSGRGYFGCVAPGFEFVEHQPSQREETELAGSNDEQAVIGSDEDEAFYRALASDMSGEPAAKATPDESDVR